MRLILSINPEREAFPICRHKLFAYLNKIPLIRSDRRRTTSLNPFHPLTIGIEFARCIMFLNTFYSYSPWQRAIFNSVRKHTFPGRSSHLHITLTQKAFVFVIIYSVWLVKHHYYYCYLIWINPYNVSRPGAHSPSEYIWCICCLVMFASSSPHTMPWQFVLIRDTILEVSEFSEGKKGTNGRPTCVRCVYLHWERWTESYSLNASWGSLKPSGFRVSTEDYQEYWILVSLHKKYHVFGNETVVILCYSLKYHINTW